MKDIVIDKTQERVGWHIHKWEGQSRPSTLVITKHRYGEERHYTHEDVYVCIICGKTKPAPMGWDDPAP